MMIFDVIISAMPLLLQGLLMTLKLWLGAMTISLVVGIVTGILRCRHMRIVYLSSFLDWMTFVLRGIPFFVQLLIVYFVLPDYLGINVSPVVAGVVSLGLCSAAYASQSVRGGIDAIVNEQWEAAQVLGLSVSQTLTWIIMPQALRTIVPVLCGEFDMVLKSTAIISTLGVLELTGAGRNIIAVDMQVGTIYGMIALLYLSVSSLLNIATTIIERKLCYGTK